jgi:predicted dehydrogenase
VSEKSLQIYAAAVIGCGRIGSGQDSPSPSLGVYSHCEALRICKRTDLAAVCDPNPEALEKCKTRWNVPTAFARVEDLLANSNPEIVSICVPDREHGQVARLVLEAPSTRCVILEKPLASTLQEALEIVEIAERREIPLLVNYTRRYCDSHRLLREFVQGGGLGKLISISGLYTKGIFHNGTHWIDLLHFLGEEFQTIHASGVVDFFGEDPTLNFSFQTRSGANGFLQGFPKDVCTVFEAEFRGELGRVRILDSGAEFEWWEIVDSPDYSGHQVFQRTPGLSGGLADAILRLVEDAISCLDSNARPICSGRDALKAMRVAAAAKSSFEENRQIQLWFSYQTSSALRQRGAAR